MEKIISLPDEYSHYGRITDRTGLGYTVESGELPENADVGDSFAYKVELWGNDSGLAYDLEET